MRGRWVYSRQTSTYISDQSARIWVPLVYALIHDGLRGLPDVGRRSKVRNLSRFADDIDCASAIISCKKRSKSVNTPSPVFSGKNRIRNVSRSLVLSWKKVISTRSDAIGPHTEVPIWQFQIKISLSTLTPDQQFAALQDPRNGPRTARFDKVRAISSAFTLDIGVYICAEVVVINGRRRIEGVS